MRVAPGWLRCAGKDSCITGCGDSSIHPGADNWTVLIPVSADSLEPGGSASPSLDGEDAVSLASHPWAPIVPAAGWSSPIRGDLLGLRIACVSLYVQPASSVPPSAVTEVNAVSSEHQSLRKTFPKLLLRVLGGGVGVGGCCCCFCSPSNLERLWIAPPCLPLAAISPSQED